MPNDIPFTYVELVLHASSSNVILKVRFSKFCFSYELSIYHSLTKLRPLFSLSHRGSDNPPLLIMFNAYYIDQSKCDFYSTTCYFESFDLLIWVDYMPEVTQNEKNKMTFIIFKILHSIWNTLSDWSKSWCNVQI